MPPQAHNAPTRSGAKVGGAAGAREGTDELSELAPSAPVRPVRANLATQEGPGRLIQDAVTAFGGLDLLVNNVGAVRPHSNGFLSFSEDDWERSLTINFLA